MIFLRADAPDDGERALFVPPPQNPCFYRAGACHGSRAEWLTSAHIRTHVRTKRTHHPALPTHKKKNSTAPPPRLSESKRRKDGAFVQ